MRTGSGSPSSASSFTNEGVSIVHAARLPNGGRSGVVDRVAFLLFVVTKQEADNDFIAPIPNPMIGRPACEPSGFVVDLDVLRLIGMRGKRGGAERSDAEDGEESHKFVVAPK